ncbi:MAG: hypothetical protein LBO74_16455 [Candidatus Symbiothrix sp.]|jgi:hypothetical protein|nr:hypothetical protein [Candidatus Symbiothrix sp.]
MKKILLVCLALIALGAANGNAQVHIGDNTDPAKGGSLLDLSSTTAKLGLLPLNVDITDLTKIPETFSQRKGDGPATDLTGLVVYNTNAALAGGVGLYVWDGAKWNPALRPLDPVIIGTYGAGDAFCNSVVFKLTKPASWPVADWAALSADNVTAKLADAAYSGTLIYNSVDDSYSYDILATAASQNAVITVSGSVNGKDFAPSNKVVTISKNTANTFTLAGEDCFDIKRTDPSEPDWNKRVQADFTKTYDYTLGGTKNSQYTIISVEWSVSDLFGAVKSFTPAATNTTLASNKTTILFDESKLIGNPLITAEGIQVVISATVMLSGPTACPAATYQLSWVVTIKDRDCCPGVRSDDGRCFVHADKAPSGFTRVSLETLTAANLDPSRVYAVYGVMWYYGTLTSTGSWVNCGDCGEGYPQDWLYRLAQADGYSTQQVERHCYAYRPTTPCWDNMKYVPPGSWFYK